MILGRNNFINHGRLMVGLSDSVKNLYTLTLIESCYGLEVTVTCTLTPNESSISINVIMNIIFVIITLIKVFKGSGVKAQSNEDES